MQSRIRHPPTHRPALSWAIIDLAVTSSQASSRGVPQELPYKILIRHVSWRDFADGSARVEHALMVPGTSQRKARVVVLLRPAARGRARTGGARCKVFP